MEIKVSTEYRGKGEQNRVRGDGEVEEKSRKKIKHQKKRGERS